jgi:hypothetical protein
MLDPAEAIATYVKAKDGNRPHLLEGAFAEDATLEMLVKTGSISFPPSSVGREAIARTLIRQFNQTFENVYTLCIGDPPAADAESFSCGWLVAMSEKDGGAIRVGCGRYDWSFTQTDHRVQTLSITIEAMEVLQAETLPSVMSWVSSLPYPWCARRTLTTAPPLLPGVMRVLQLLR